MDRAVAPDSLFLASIANALRRRSKALKHRAGKREIERVIEERDDEILERLEVRLARNNSRSSPRLSASFWSDRWVWIDVRKGDKRGWQFEWTMSGRLLNPEDTSHLIEAIEESLSATKNIEQASAERLSEIWRPMLASGPRSSAE